MLYHKTTAECDIVGEVSFNFPLRNRVTGSTNLLGLYKADFSETELLANSVFLINSCWYTFYDCRKAFIVISVFRGREVCELAANSIIPNIKVVIAQMRTRDSFARWGSNCEAQQIHSESMQFTCHVPGTRIPSFAVPLDAPVKYLHLVLLVFPCSRAIYANNGFFATLML